MHHVLGSKPYDLGIVRNVVSFYGPPKSLHDGVDQIRVVS